MMILLVMILLDNIQYHLNVFKAVIKIIIIIILLLFNLGYRHIPLLNNEGELLENSTIFVHIAITNRRGGGV